MAKPAETRTGKPTDYDLPFAAPTPALDRPEGQLRRNEERRCDHRCARVDRARSQTEKDGVSRSDSDEAPGQKSRPTTHERKSPNREPDGADRGHDGDKAVAGRRRVRDHGTKERKGCQSGGYTRTVLA